MRLLGLREGAFILLLMCMPGLTWWFVLRKDASRNAEMMQSVSTQCAGLHELAAVSRAVDKLGADCRQLTKANERFHARLPAEKDIDEVLKDTWQLAESNQLTTKSIRIVDSDRNRLGTSNIPYREQPIAMQIGGDFMGFYGFLLTLENQPRVMRIQKIDIKHLDNSRPGQIEADLLISVFSERSKPGDIPAEDGL